MTDKTGSLWRISKAVLVGCAALYIIGFAVISCYRIAYPFELEWMEGGTVDHLARVVEGKQLYVEPTIEFVPYIYTPLYYYLSAVPTIFTGVSFVPLRLVSALSTLGSLLLIFLMVRHFGRSTQWALVAAGIFAATFRIGGAWFDVARVDSLFLFLMLAVIYCVTCKESQRSAIICGLLVTLAVLTKQTGLLLGTTVGLSYLILSRRQFIYYGITATVCTGLSLLLLNVTSDGWFWYYAFELPQGHAIQQFRYLTFWSVDLLPNLPIAIAASLFFMLQIKTVLPPRKVWVWIILTFTMIGIALLGRIHSGGYDNVLMPAHAIFALLAGLGGSVMFNITSSAKSKHRTPTMLFVSLAFVFQFGLLYYNPIAQIPTDKDREAGEQLIARIASYEGEVYVPAHGHLTSMAGKRSWAHTMAFADILRGRSNNGIAEAFKADIEKALAEEKFEVVISDGQGRWLEKKIKDHYGKDGPVFDNPAVFFPVTGWRIRPETIYTNLIPTVTEASLRDRKTQGTPFNCEGCLIIRGLGISVLLSEPRPADSLEISVDHNDVYTLEFLLDSVEVGIVTVPIQLIHGGGLRVDTIMIPDDARSQTFDQIIIVPSGGDNRYSVGHLLLF